jgi:hypothetical protein
MEKWILITELQGNYEISNIGRVRSVFKVISKSDNTVYTRKPKIIKSQLREGYQRVRLCIDNVRVTKSVHRLVAKYFIDNPNDLPQVNHINANKTDNAVENLEWCSASQNIKHAIKNGLRKTAIGKNKPKMVLDIYTGIYYKSLREASILKNINYSGLQHQINGKVSNRSGLIYV